MKGRAWAALGSVAAAIASSACCWLPFGAAALGLGMGGAAALFDRFRLPLMLVAVGLLALGYSLNYRPAPECAPDEACATPDPRLQRLNRVLLWVSTAVVAGFVAFPWLQPYLPVGLGGLGSSGPGVRADVRALSRDARELRQAFNRDRGKTRILVLLSPT